MCIINRSLCHDLKLVGCTLCEGVAGWCRDSNTRIRIVASAIFHTVASAIFHTIVRPIIRLANPSSIDEAQVPSDRNGGYTAPPLINEPQTTLGYTADYSRQIESIQQINDINQYTESTIQDIRSQRQEIASLTQEVYQMFQNNQYVI